MSNLQNQIDKTSKNGIVELRYGAEYRENIIIKKPITIRSISTRGTIVESTPTITIQSKNVILENLNIVCNDKNGICLSVKKKNKPIMNNIFVKGRVEGLDGEEGNWEIPEVLELNIVPNKINKKKFIISCPVPVKIYPSDLSMITCVPQDLESGINEIMLTIDEITKNSFITGDLILETLSYKLKRKIAITGNSLELLHGVTPPVEETIWMCPSVKSTINPKVLKKLPKGTQGELYEFILDEDGLNCKGFNIMIDRLPEGLNFNKQLIPKIEGIPKKYGEFEIEFVFEKDDIEHRYTSKLIIDEKVIIPLKIAPIKDPVRVIEDEMIRIKMEVISCNSNDLTFKKTKDLPDGLQLNEVSGELWGKISKHGKYNTTVVIDDKTSMLHQDINLYVVPKDPLTMDLNKTYQFYKNDNFKIIINVPDANRLLPKIKLKDQHSGQIKVELINQDYFLKGKLTEIKTYEVEINIEDVYKRKYEEIIHLQCIEKPSYTFRWLTTSPIQKKGLRLNRFSEQIKAEINEDKKLKLKYTCINKLPQKYTFTEDGWLEGIIDGNVHSIKIRAEIGEWQSEKQFEIKTDIESCSKIVKSDQISKMVFGYFNEKEDVKKKVDIKIKNDFKKGRVKEPYSDTILTEHSDIPTKLSLKISNLPEGLTYNQKMQTIEGIPKKEGLYEIDIFNPIDNGTYQIKLVIAKSPYFHKDDNKPEPPDKKRSKASTKIKLGKAFDKF